MRHNIIAIIIIAVSAVLLASCNKTPEISQSQEAFNKMTDYGFVMGNQYKITYNNENTQMASNSKGAFRIFKDDLSAYATMEAAGEFTNVGDSFKAKVSWFESGSPVSKEINMTLSKVEDSKFWFWNESEQIGMIVKKH